MPFRELLLAYAFIAAGYAFLLLLYVYRTAG